MSTRSDGPPAVPTFSIILFALAVLVWVGVIATAATINDSDAAGNGLSYSLGVLMAIGLWVLLAALLISIGVRGLIPRAGVLAAVILVPASGAAAVAAFNLLRERAAPSGWPIIIPALVPALIFVYVLWASLPGIRAMLPDPIATGIVWGAALILAMAPWPLVNARSRAGEEQRARVEAEGRAEEARQREAAERENREKFEKLTPESPLWEWMLLTVGDNEYRDRALEGARHLKRRQGDAEEMLANGHDFPLRELPRLDLEVTPKFCELSRAFLIRHAEAWRTTVPNPPAFAVRAESIERYLPAMEWLQGHGCDLAAQVAALEVTVRGYPEAADRDRFLAALARVAGSR